MKLPKKTTSIILFSIIGVALIASATTILVVNANDVEITFLPSNISNLPEYPEEGWMSSILIEYKGTLIYIDPYNIDEASEKADGILITHPHGDHYDQDTIDLIAQDSTEFVGPASCTTFISENGGTGVVPGDNGTIAGISFTAIPAYNAGHPIENQWCGYVITIEGYSILIPGDTGNIPEYYEWRDRIDVAFLPVEYSCSNMGPDGAIDAIGVLRPTMVVPIHYGFVENLEPFLEMVEINELDVEIYERELVLE